MMSVRAKRALWNGCHAISKRIIKIRFYLKHKKLTVIQTHAPRKMRRMRKRMNFTTSCKTLLEVAVVMI